MIVATGTENAATFAAIWVSARKARNLKDILARSAVDVIFTHRRAKVVLPSAREGWS